MRTRSNPPFYLAIWENEYTLGRSNIIVVHHNKGACLKNLLQPTFYLLHVNQQSNISQQVHTVHGVNLAQWVTILAVNPNATHTYTYVLVNVLVNHSTELLLNKSIEIKRAFGYVSPQGRVGRETDYVVSMHPTPPRTIHPPHQIANNPWGICNCTSEAPDAFRQHSQFTTWYTV